MKNLDWENQEEMKEDLMNYFCDLVIPEIFKAIKAMNQKKSIIFDKENFEAKITEKIATMTFRELSHFIKFQPKNKVFISKLLFTKVFWLSKIRSLSRRKINCFTFLGTPESKEENVNDASFDANAKLIKM